MGIFTFAGSWVLKKFRGTLVVQNYVPADIISVSIDMNGVIHKVLSKVFYYGEFTDDEKHTVTMNTTWDEMKPKIFTEMMKELDAIIARLMPKDKLSIYIDGPTNIAKMWQQRTRRYRTAFYSTEDTFDNSIVTPGTDFMFELDGSIRSDIYSRRASYPTYLLYSSHLVGGEGEHKMMEHFRKNINNDIGKHVVYGLDADLILLSLISLQKEIVLVREDRNELLDIELFKQELINAAPAELQNTAVIDFVILMTLVGNDFIPHGPLHQSMYELVEELLAIYYELLTPISVVNNGIFTVNLKALGQIAIRMHKVQTERLAYEAMNPNYRDDKPAEYNRFTQGALRKTKEDEIVFDYSIFRSIWYTNAFSCNIGDNPIDNSYTEEDMDDMCESYVQGIIWCMRYYQTKDVSQRWVYPYYHAPLYIDLGRYMISLDDDFGIKLDNWLNVPHELNWDALVQLACVIPKSSKGFPVPLRKLAKPNSPIIDMFPDKIVFESDGFDEVRNYNVIMPNISIYRVIEAVNQIKIPKMIRRKWNLVEESVYYSTESQKQIYDIWYKNQIYVNKYLQDKQQSIYKMKNLTYTRDTRGRGRGRGRSRPSEDIVYSQVTRGTQGGVRTRGKFI